ncbi:MAG: STAS/SEC14 domain-containing protein [bacterium]
MYCLKVFRKDGLVKLAVHGDVSEEEMQALGRDLERELLTPDRSNRRVLADLRRTKPLTSDVAAVLRVIEEHSIDTGGARIAEVVQSQLVAAQLEQVTGSAGLGEHIRHFCELEPALAWLAEPPPKPRTP